MKSFFLFLTGLTLFSACNTTGGWEEYPFTELPPAERSHILVEEFTGQKCVNCPEAAAELQRIARMLSPNVTVVSLHAARSGQTLSALSSAQADKVAEALHIPLSAPHAAFNRKNYENRRFITDRAAWEAAILDAVHTRASYRIDLKASIVDDKLNLHTEIARRTEKWHPLSLQLWLVEDIRATQLTAAGVRKDYFHHNVFRGALNGLDGEELSPDAKQTSLQLEHRFSIPDNVVEVKNAKVVAFVINRSSGEVLEAAVCALGEGITDENTHDNPDTSTDPEANKDKVPWFTVGTETPTTLYNGETLVSETAFRSMGGTTVETPSLFPHPGSEHGNGQYKVVVTKLDHLDDAICGISEVCTEGQCTPSAEVTTFSSSFTISDKLPFSQFLSIHYLISPEKENTPDVYKVKVSLQKDDVEVAHYFMEFRYDPQRVTLLE